MITVGKDTERLLSKCCDNMNNLDENMIAMVGCQQYQSGCLL
jgi:hypothetical protein